MFGKEQEQQVPPLVKAAEAVKQFASEEVEESDKFKQAVEAVAQKMGGSSNPEILEGAKKLVKQGVSMVASRIGLLPAFMNPDNRKEVVDKLKKDKVEGKWVDILASWNVSGDPNGLGVLEKCKQSDISEIMSKTKEAENEQAKAQIQLQADAIAAGQDVLIEYYKKQISSPNSLKMAA